MAASTASITSTASTIITSISITGSWVLLGDSAGNYTIYYWIANFSSISEDLRSHVLSNDDQKSYSSSISMDYVCDLPMKDNLHPVALKSLNVENAGGGSEVSEAFTINHLILFYGANPDSFLFENQVSYDFEHKMVDMICMIGSVRVGISVTRAMGYPKEDRFTIITARTLLYKKINGLVIARNGVTKDQRFYKCILHVWCQSYRIAMLMQQAYSELDINDFDLDASDHLILHLTSCDNRSIYSNRF